LESLPFSRFLLSSIIFYYFPFVKQNKQITRWFLLFIGCFHQSNAGVQLKKRGRRKAGPEWGVPPETRQYSCQDSAEKWSEEEKDAHKEQNRNAIDFRCRKPKALNLYCNTATGCHTGCPG